MPSLTARWSLTLGLLALLAACRPETKPAAPKPPPATVTVAQPIARTVTDWDEFSGRLASPETVEIRARVSGHLDKVHFVEGSEVKAGDLLFTIDPREHTAAVAEAEAEVARARIRHELAEGEAKRAQPLAASKALSVDTYETRQKTATEALQAVKAAEASLAAAKLDLEFTEVRAPISGRISNARVTAGNLVIGGTNNPTLLTTIVSLDPIHCYIEVDERSSLRYRQLAREGKRPSALFQPVEARMQLSGETGFPHVGKIDFVDNQLNPTTGTIRARAVFPNPDRLIAPGFFARVQIPGSGDYAAVLVRDSAIGNDQGKPFVLVVDDKNTVVYRQVTLGPMLDGLRIVRDGLKAEERIIVNGLLSGRPGQTVNAQPGEMALPATAAATATTPSAK